MSDKAAETANAEELVTRIGLRVREIRRERGITLERLAEETGFTKSYLSKIENSKKVPPVASLVRISGALGVDISVFLETTSEATEKLPLSEPKLSFVRSSGRPTVAGGTTFGYDYQSLLQGTFERHMEPFIATFPHQMSRDVRFEHEGEEFLFVLSGRIHFEVEDRSFILEAGDSLFFDSRLPHRGEAIGSEAKALLIVLKDLPETD